MKIVDCIGLYCPEPVFRTRKAIEEAKEGDSIVVLADDPAAESDIPFLVKKLGQELIEFVKDDDGVVKFVIRIVREIG